jgi:diaminopimelate decarboxylase
VSDDVNSIGGVADASQAVVRGTPPTPDEGPVSEYLLPMTARVSNDGHLSVGGVDLDSLAEELGTPLFVYDEGHLRDRCRQAVEAWGEGVAYATKAFLCKAVARLAYEEGMHLDVSTGGELHVALAAGVPPARLRLHGNNKSLDELQTALRLGIGRIVVDSNDEIDRLEELLASGVAEGRRPPAVLVRVNPAVEAHTHEFVRTGQEDCKFGFGVASGAALDATNRLRAMKGLHLVGIHAHIGSQIFRVESFCQELEVLAKFFTPLGLEELCMGGGLGVPYVAGEAAPTIGEWAKTVRDTGARCGISASTRLTAEPGRAIVATAGITLYRVGTVKKLEGLRTYVSVDGGMSDNPRPLLYGSGYEAFVPREANARRPQAVRIVGKHCESGDIVVPDARVPDDLAVGDILATPVTGAYGYAMASNYNKVPRPAVVFVANGRHRVVVRRESEEDLLRLDA